MPNFVCYNCGQQNDHFSRKCTKLAQQHTRCRCWNVAFSAVQHKVDCRTPGFVSTKIGAYELPLLEFHNICFKFKNVHQIYSAETTTMGVQNFLIAKFTSIGTNIRIHRRYSEQQLTIEMKIKPAITLAFGRYKENGHMASLMICNDQIRVNHFQHIDKNGVVSYNLTATPKKSEKHDVDLRLESKERVIWFIICWNRLWTANVGMSQHAFSIGRYSNSNENEL